MKSISADVVAVFALEDWLTCRDAREMFPAIPNETRTGFEHARLDIDMSLFDTLARLGTLRLFTVRIDGVLVGMSMTHVAPHPLMARTLCAHHANIYLQPAWRGQGLAQQLLQHIEEVLQAEGVEIMYVARTIASSADMLYQRAGFAVCDVVYNKLLR